MEVVNVEAETMAPLLDNMSVPRVFPRLGVEKLAESSWLLPRTTFPTPSFTRARLDGSGKRLPQAIAHRGYRAKFPENTMKAFAGAVEVGAHALETDVHLSKDGVVVLSHDATLERCFGEKKKIIDCDWEYLSKIETLKEPKQHMPRLTDLLEYLAKPGLEDIWVLLDIKLDNDANDVMRLIAETIRHVTPSPTRAWEERILLGCWASKFLPLCNDYLPDFPVTHIGFSTSYAQQFFAVPNVSFNMLQDILMGPFGARFLRKARRLNRPIYAWTVNKERRMRWCVRKGLDGVCTDDPKAFLEVCEEEEGKVEWMGCVDLLDVLRIHILAFIFMILLRRKFGYGLDQRLLRPRTNSGMEE